MYTTKARLYANNESTYTFEQSGDNPVLVIKNAAIVFSNFEGRNNYNRSLTICLSDEVANTLREMGMYVKTYTNQDGDEEYHIDVAIGNKDETICPAISVYTTFNGKTSCTDLDFSNMKQLDNGYYSRIWLKVTLRKKANPDRYGSRKGYLRSLKCQMEEQTSAFDSEYESFIGFNPDNYEV